jgi:hypothetical protein
MDKVHPNAPKVVEPRGPPLRSCQSERFISSKYDQICNEYKPHAKIDGVVLAQARGVAKLLMEACRAVDFPEHNFVWEQKYLDDLIYQMRANWAADLLTINIVILVTTATFENTCIPNMLLMTMESRVLANLRRLARIVTKNQSW